jgi:hypothetical protein
VLVLAAGDATGATVRAGPVVLHAEGSFSPHVLPKRTYAPVALSAEVDVHSTEASEPPVVKEAVLEFDRDGLLSTRGLPVCRRAQIAHVGVAQARRRCAGSIVGTGHLNAVVTVSLLRIKVRAALTLFNGPRRGGTPTVLAHAQPVALIDDVYVVSVPIEPERGSYGYRATIDVPRLLGGAATLTEVDAKLGRRYRFHGAERSYASARCSDGTLGIRGRLTFVGAPAVEGTIEQACTALP